MPLVMWPFMLACLYNCRELRYLIAKSFVYSNAIDYFPILLKDFSFLRK